MFQVNVKYLKNKWWYLHKGISILNICEIFWYKTVAIFTDIQLQSCIIMTSAREENLKINLGKGHQCKFSVSGYHILNRSCDSHQFSVISEQKSSFLLKIRISIKIRRFLALEPMEIWAQNSIFEFFSSRFKFISGILKNSNLNFGLKIRFSNLKSAF